jgi:hypothetical protein
MPRALALSGICKLVDGGDIGDTGIIDDYVEGANRADRFGRHCLVLLGLGQIGARPETYATKQRHFE